MKTSLQTVFSLGALALLLTACNNTNSTAKLMEQQIEQQTGHNADVDVNNDGTMKIETDEGTMQTGTSVPESWPSDVVIYKGATVVWSTEMTNPNGKAGTAVTFTTGDSEQAVTDFYKQSMKDNGWKVETTLQTGEGVMMIASKDEQVLSLSISRTDEGTTTVNASVGQQ